MHSSLKNRVIVQRRINSLEMAKPTNCCLSCKSTEELFSLYDDHECADFGDIQASATMLKECYNIEITPASNFTSICGQCMLRLRDAYLFKRDIIKSIQELQKQPFLIKALAPDGAQQMRDTGTYLDTETGLRTNSDIDKLSEKVEENRLNVISLENTLLLELKPLEKCKETGTYQDAKLDDETKNQCTVQPGQTDCTICNIKFPTTKSLQGHMNVHFARYMCCKCGARFEADSRLRRHMATVHMEGPFMCTICDQTFSKVNSLNAHIWRVHQTLDPYKCSKCEQRFRTFHKRLRHLQEDHGMNEAKYPCPYCEKKFFYAGSRSTHIRLTHLQERKCKCTHCPMTFGKRRMLLNHLSTIHGIGEKRHQCHKCEKWFFRSNTLKHHLKGHEKAEQELYQCPVCGVRFSYKNHLNGHMKCHNDALDAEEKSTEETVVIVEDKLYDVTNNDTVYLEIYET